LQPLKNGVQHGPRFFSLIRDTPNRTRQARLALETPQAGKLAYDRRAAHLRSAERRFYLCRGGIS